MNTVKPTKTGLAKISIPHEKQTEYLIDGVPNVRIRVGATGNLGFSLLNRVDGKMRRISMEVHDHSKNGILDAMLRAQGQAEVKASLDDKTLRASGATMAPSTRARLSTPINKVLYSRMPGANTVFVCCMEQIAAGGYYLPYALSARLL